MWSCHRRQFFCDEFQIAINFPYRSGVMARSGFGWSGVSGVVGPSLKRSPWAVGCEVNAEGTGGTVGGQDLGETIADLRECGGESAQAGDRSHTSEVRGVAGGVEVAVENGGVLSPSTNTGGRGWGA